MKQGLHLASGTSMIKSRSPIQSSSERGEVLTEGSK